MLEIKNLKVTFNKNTVDEKIALNKIYLNLEEGDFITIIGNNGAGKSTLLNSIFGLVETDKGKIILDNKDITALSSHKRAKEIGMVFQNPSYGTAPHMTIGENLALATMSDKKGNPFSKCMTKSNIAQFRELLKTLDLGLEDRINANVGLLSGGQRQALSLLMATVSNPKLLLLDEHTAALDPKTATKILTITQDIITKKHLTTIMITHNIDNAIKYGNKLVLMQNGNIIKVYEKEEKHKLNISDVMKLYANTITDEMIL